MIYQNTYSFLKRGVRDYPLVIIGITAASILLSFFEVIGFVTIIPVIEGFFFVSDEKSLIYNFYQDIFNILGVDFNLLNLLVSLSITFILKAVCQFICYYFQGAIEVNAVVKLKNKGFDLVLNESWDKAIKRKIGDSINNLTFIIPQAGRGLKFLSTLISECIYSFLMIAFCMFYSPSLSIGIIVVGILVIITNRIVGKQASSLGEKTQSNLDDINETIVSTLNQQKRVVLSNLSTKIIQTFKNDIHISKAINLKFLKIQSLLGVLVEPLIIIASLMIVYFAFENNFGNIDEILIAVLIFYRASGAIRNLPKSISTVAYYWPMYKNVHDLFSDLENNQEVSGTKKIKTFKNNICFKNIDFGYSQDDLIFKNLSFEISKGEFLGITGRSGCGKSTLISLLLKLYQPQSGEIFIDGINYKLIDNKSLRDLVAYVGQDSELFNTTVSENISIGTNNISKDEIVAASMKASSHGFIQELPNKYATKVGEKGSSLSAGQKQRILLANAFNKNPQIVIFDESTSNLDLYSQQLVVDKLHESKNITRLFIAHRLEALEKCDRVILLEKNGTYKEGKPDKLLKEYLNPSI